MKNLADPPLSTGNRISAASPAEIWRSTKPWFIPYLLIALTAVFYLPRLVPSAPSASDSYLFGYNNRAGILLLVFFVAAGVLLTRGFGLLPAGKSTPAPLPRWVLALALLGVVIACGAMYYVAGRYHGFGESFYLIDRIALLDGGRVPYRDFEFVYGPAQLYIPLFLHRILPLGIADAYYLFWTISYLLGAFFFFKCVDELPFPTRSKPAIFLMLYAAGLFAAIRMGTNYTFLRYALPLYLVVKLNSRFRDCRAPKIFVDVLLSAAFCALLVLSSPETAVAFAFASICIALFCRPAPLVRRIVTAALLVATYSATFLVAHSLHVLDAMLADGGGAISFPIVPSPPILVYFIAVFICACCLFCSLITPSTDDPTLGLLFYSIPMIAAVLGRCDPSHVYWNGLSAFLASLLYLSLFKRAWPIYAVSFVLFVFIAPNLSEFYLFAPQLRSALNLNKHPEARPVDANIQAFLTSWPGNYVAPFGFRPGGFGTYQSPRIEYGRFEDLIDVSTPHSIQEKVQEMRSAADRALILPYHHDEYCRVFPVREKHYLVILLLSPYIGSPVHTDPPRAPICQYIRDHYRMLLEPSASTWWYGIWVPSESR